MLSLVAVLSQKRVLCWLETSEKQMTKYWFCDVLSRIGRLNQGLFLKPMWFAHFFKAETVSDFILECVWVGVEKDTASRWNLWRRICLGIIIWVGEGVSISLDQSGNKFGRRKVAFFNVFFSPLIFVWFYWYKWCSLIKCSKNWTSDFHSRY